MRAPHRFRRYAPRVGAGFELCVSRNTRPPRNQVDGAWFDVPSGTLLVVEPGTVWHAQGADAFRSLEIDPEVFESWRAEVGVPVFHAPRYTPDAVPGLGAWFENAHAQLEAEPDPLAAGERVAAIVATVVGRCTDAVPRPLRVDDVKPLDRVRDLLRLESSRQLGLDDIVDLAGVPMGRFHLLRSFKRRFGVTPHQYQRLVRLSEALRFMRAGMPVAQAAIEAGFHDQPHLTRQFARVYGVTPGAYLRGQPRTR